MQRRSFLKFLGAAPVAAPVVAREAAARAGVSVGMPVTSALTGASGAVMGGSISASKSWTDEAVRFLSASAAGKRDLARKEDFFRHEFGSRLDPDLASSRSLSLSAAIRIQRERNLDIYTAMIERRMLERYLEATGMPWSDAIAKGVETIKTAVIGESARG